MYKIPKAKFNIPAIKMNICDVPIIILPSLQEVELVTYWNQSIESTTTYNIIATLLPLYNVKNLK